MSGYRKSDSFLSQPKVGRKTGFQVTWTPKRGPNGLEDPKEFFLSDEEFESTELNNATSPKKRLSMRFDQLKNIENQNKSPKQNALIEENIPSNENDQPISTKSPSHFETVTDIVENTINSNSNSKNTSYIETPVTPTKNKSNVPILSSSPFEEELKSMESTTAISGNTSNGIKLTKNIALNKFTKNSKFQPQNIVNASSEESDKVVHQSPEKLESEVKDVQKSADEDTTPKSNNAEPDVVPKVDSTNNDQEENALEKETDNKKDDLTVEDKRKSSDNIDVISNQSESKVVGNKKDDLIVEEKVQKIEVENNTSEKSIRIEEEEQNNKEEYPIEKQKTPKAQTSSVNIKKLNVEFSTTETSLSTPTPTPRKSKTTESAKKGKIFKIKEVTANEIFAKVASKEDQKNFDSVTSRESRTPRKAATKYVAPVLDVSTDESSSESDNEAEKEMTPASKDKENSDGGSSENTGELSDESTDESDDDIKTIETVSITRRVVESASDNDDENDVNISKHLIEKESAPNSPMKKTPVKTAKVSKLVVPTEKKKPIKTQAKKAQLPKPHASPTRRSTRTRIPPIASWKNEKVVYKTEKINGVIVKSVDNVLHRPDNTLGVQSFSQSKKRGIAKHTESIDLSDTEPKSKKSVSKPKSTKSKPKEIVSKSVKTLNKKTSPVAVSKVEKRKLQEEETNHRKKQKTVATKPSKSSKPVKTTKRDKTPKSVEKGQPVKTQTSVTELSADEQGDDSVHSDIDAADDDDIDDEGIDDEDSDENNNTLTEWKNSKDKALTISVFEGPGTEKQIRRTVAFAPDSYKNVTLIKNDDEYFKVGTLFDQDSEFCGGGILELPSGAKKAVKSNHDTYFIFYVISGHVEVTLSRNTFVVTKGCSFEIPMGNYYQFFNTGSEMAKMMFVQSKYIVIGGVESASDMEGSVIESDY